MAGRSPLGAGGRLGMAELIWFCASWLWPELLWCDFPVASWLYGSISFLSVIHFFTSLLPVLMGLHFEIHS